MYADELMWPSKTKPLACSSLKAVQNNWQEEVKFTFNDVKYEKTFDELLKNGNIKMTCTIPPADELKMWAYCKWHNYFYHATIDCNVFRR